MTVVIPCRDDGPFLLDALASLRLCEHEQLEAIVVDDGSRDDDTRTILGLLETHGITVLAGQRRGPAAARNVGRSAARARFLLPLDADNLLRPGFVPAALTELDARR